MPQWILIAEDDAINRKLILRQMAMLGHSAEVAVSGLEALSLLKARRYALLLTDLHMPEMDGCTLIETIRRGETGGGSRHARLPIVALTADASWGESQRAIAAGADEYLTKPARLEHLSAAIERWMVRGTGPGDGDACLQAPACPPILDIGVLESLVGADRDVVSEFLRDFRTTARDASADMAAAAKLGDVARVGAIAHRLKSSSRSVGALALGDFCAQLENACTINSHTEAARLLSSVDQALADVESKLMRHLRAV